MHCISWEICSSRFPRELEGTESMITSSSFFNFFKNNTTDQCPSEFIQALYLTKKKKTLSGFLFLLGNYVRERERESEAKWWWWNQSFAGLNELFFKGLTWKNRKMGLGFQKWTCAWDSVAFSSNWLVDRCLRLDRTITKDVHGGDYRRVWQNLFLYFIA